MITEYNVFMIQITNIIAVIKMNRKFSREERTGTAAFFLFSHMHTLL